MNEIIRNALNDIDIQNFYLTRGNVAPKDVYVVFSHVSTPSCYADNKKGGEEYSILVNMYCKKSIEANKKLIIDTLNSVGLKGGTTQNSMKEDTGYYNTPISFKYFLRSE